MFSEEPDSDVVFPLKTMLGLDFLVLLERLHFSLHCMTV